MPVEGNANVDPGFAGGDPMDMALTYGISEKSARKSKTYVMEAINNEEGWDTLYPERQDERRAIVRQFEQVRRQRFYL